VNCNGAAAGAGPKRAADQSAVGGSVKKQARKNAIPDMTNLSQDERNVHPIFGKQNVDDKMVDFVHNAKTTFRDVVLKMLVSVKTKKKGDIVEHNKIYNHQEFHKLECNFVNFFADAYNYEYDLLKEEWDMDDIAERLRETWEEDWQFTEDKNDCAYCHCEPDELFLCENEQRDGCGFTNTLCNTQFCGDCGPIMVRDGDLRFCKEHNNEDAIEMTLHCREERKLAEAFKKEQLEALNKRSEFQKYHDKKILDPVQLVTGKGISSSKKIAELLGCEPREEYTAQEIRQVFFVYTDKNGNPKLRIRKKDDEEYEDEESEDEESEESSSEDSSSEEDSSEDSSYEEDSSEEESSSEEDSSDESSSNSNEASSDILLVLVLVLLFLVLLLLLLPFLPPLFLSGLGDLSVLFGLLDLVVDGVCDFLHVEGHVVLLAKYLLKADRKGLAHEETPVFGGKVLVLLRRFDGIGDELLDGIIEDEVDALRLCLLLRKSDAFGVGVVIFDVVVLHLLDKVHVVFIFVVVLREGVDDFDV
jgi:hypothetical protein